MEDALEGQDKRYEASFEYMWALRGFNRPTDVDKQIGLIAKGAHIAVRNGPVYYK
jgi:hypothetical protein